MIFETYAICGPDGAGKSTLTHELEKLGWNIQYGGKKENHFLIIMKWNFKVYLLLKRIKIKSITLLYLYTIFYFIEYLEYFAKLRFARNKNKKKINVVFDRFYTDRMWKKYIKSKFPISFFDKFYYTFYYYFFPKKVNLIFVLPNKHLLFKRRSKDYGSLENCSNVLLAYKNLFDDLKKSGLNIMLIEKQDIKENIDRIITWKRNDKKNL